MSFFAGVGEASKSHNMEGRNTEKSLPSFSTLRLEESEGRRK